MKARPFFAASLLLLLAAWVLTGGSCSNTMGGVRPPRDVVLHVENHSWSDATVYSVRSGVRMRLGDVIATSGAVMRVRYSTLNTGVLELEIQFIGSGETLLTPPVRVEAGQRVNVTIELYLPSSTVTPMRDHD